MADASGVSFYPEHNCYPDHNCDVPTGAERSLLKEI